MASRDFPTVELAPGYAIPRLINGCWQLSSGHGGNRATGRTLTDRLHRLVDAGLTAFDCADIYTGVESVLGQFIRSGRLKNRVQVHTKFVPDLDSLGALRPRDVESVIDRSLSRLGVERLDLVQFHWWDYQVGGYLEALETLDRLKQSGKIRLLGLTNFNTQRVVEIHAAGFNIASLQVQYSLVDRRPSGLLARECRRIGIHLLAYGSLAGGLLARPGLLDKPFATRSLAKYSLIVRDAGGAAGLNRVFETVSGIAARRQCRPSSVAMRWVMDQPAVAAIIAGVGNTDRSAQNAEIAGLELDQEDRERLAKVIDSLPLPEGDVFDLERHPGGAHASLMKMNLNRESLDSDG